MYIYVKIPKLHKAMCLMIYHFIRHCGLISSLNLNWSVRNVPHTLVYRSGLQHEVSLLHDLKTHLLYDSPLLDSWWLVGLTWWAMTKSTHTFSLISSFNYYHRYRLTESWHFLTTQQIHRVGSRLSQFQYHAVIFAWCHTNFEPERFHVSGDVAIFSSL